MGIFLIRQEMRYVPAEALGYAQCVCLTFQPIEDHDSFFPPLFVRYSDSYFYQIQLSTQYYLMHFLVYCFPPSILYKTKGIIE